MDKLAKALKYWIHKKLNEDNAWKKIKVILSDANVPGEGEHKIAAFIRSVRAQPGMFSHTQMNILSKHTETCLSFAQIRNSKNNNKKKQKQGTIQTQDMYCMAWMLICLCLDLQLMSLILLF